MPHFRTLKDARVKDQTVLLRADLNVPLQNGHVTDVTRIEAILPTIQELQKKGAAKIVLLSHFGRPTPSTDVTQWDQTLSLKHIVPVLEKILSTHIEFLDEPIGTNIQDKIVQAPQGTIFLLENLRFYPGEEANEAAFSEQLSRLGDIYVNDAFSCAHRAHASITGIGTFLELVVGRSMEYEIRMLERVLCDPKRPVCAIVGGSKISTKLTLLENLIPRVDYLIVGGAMAHTFWRAQGFEIGVSLCEEDQVLVAKGLLEKYGEKIILPMDGVLENHQVVSCREIPHNGRVLDAGPKSLACFEEVLKKCATIIWNGPLGMFETPPFDQSTHALAHVIASLTKEGCVCSVAGGGDTVAALKQAEVFDALSFVSTAGGAFLEWFEGKKLPGVEALCLEK